MVGGPQKQLNELNSIFISLGPENSYAHVGKSGAGHFAKMIHNALEYVMLQELQNLLNVCPDLILILTLSKLQNSGITEQL